MNSFNSNSAGVIVTVRASGAVGVCSDERGTEAAVAAAGDTMSSEGWD